KNYRFLEAFDQQYFLYERLEDFRALEDIELLVPPQAGGRWHQARRLAELVNQVSEEYLDVATLLAAPEPEIRALGRCTAYYRERLAEENSLDFSTIQSEALHLLETQPQVLARLQEHLRYLMVDEYQDTNTVQEMILLHLAGERSNLCVVGDDDQGLYRFRGATIRNILEFPQHFAPGRCKQVRLTTNFRSHPGIIDFYNAWMQRQNWAGPGGVSFRFGKTIQPRPEPFKPMPTVVRVGAAGTDAWHQEILKFLLTLEADGTITNRNQVAFLFRSVRSDEVRGLAEYLERHGVNVYSPRSALFFEREEVQLVLGALVFLFPDLFEQLKWNDEAELGVWAYYQACKLRFANRLRENRELHANLIKWCGITAKAHATMQGPTNYAFSGLFYNLFQFSLFAPYLETDLNAGARDLRAPYNLALLSQLIVKFEYLQNITVLTPKIYQRVLRSFFNHYLRFLYDGGIEEYEGFEEYAPSGCMKFFDFYRLYYTAFSRPQNLLALTSPERTGHGANPSRWFQEVYQALPRWEGEGFDHRALELEHVKPVNVKYEYSFTSDILLYENCPLQYKFFKELAFASVRTAGPMFGTLVHQTIEDMHKAVLTGREQDVTLDNIERWFGANYQSLCKALNAYLAPAQQQAALNQVLAYERRHQHDWARLREAEVDVSLVKEEYILKGTIDLIRGENGTVEVVDFKTDRKPDVNHPEDRIKLARYQRQLEVYGHLVEQRLGHKVSKLHLYYTSEKEGNPYISFDYFAPSIQDTIATFDEVWKGKRPFRSTHYYPAQHKETHGEEVNGWLNQIFWGDNLQVMSHLLKKYRGQVKLVYIDPPFDSKADYKLIIKLRGQTVENTSSVFEEKQYSDIWTNDEYLQFMYERLIIIKELLSSDGAILVHCDWHKTHHLRCLLDEVFGNTNFRNEIIWAYPGREMHIDNKYNAKHDTILFYTKSPEAKVNMSAVALPYNREERIIGLRRKVHVDEDGHEWVWETRGQSAGQEPYKRLIDDIIKDGRALNDVWGDIQFLRGNDPQRTGYPTQKPEELLERIIKAHSKPGDIVFDCFMGSGTTQSVAVKLGRRFLGADINLGAVQTTTKRLIGISQELQRDKLTIDVDKPLCYTGFAVYNVNHYDIFRNPIQAKDLLIEALEIQPLPSGSVFDGEQDGYMVKIMPVNRIATKADLRELVMNIDQKEFMRRRDELGPNKAVEHIRLVCMGHDPDLGAELQRELSDFKLKVEVVDILRDRGSGYLRLPQYEALEMYVFLKEFCGNAPLHQVFRDWRESKGPFEGRQRFTLKRGASGDGTLGLFEEEDAKAFDLAFQRLTENPAEYANYIFALTMGLGKTILMGTCIFYEFLLANKYPKDERFAHNAIVFAPDKTVLTSLREIQTFDKSRVKVILKKQHKERSKAQLFIEGTESLYKAKSLNADFADLYGFDDEVELLENQRFAKLTRLRQLAVYVDEAHHAFGDKLAKSLSSFRLTINELAANLKEAGTRLDALGISHTRILVNVGDPKLTSNDDLREFNNLDKPSSEKQFILLVNKGKEGWNCRSLFAVGLFREPKSKIFVLQASMRCLRSITDVQQTGDIYLSEANYKLLDDELQANLNMTVQELGEAGKGAGTTTYQVRVTEPIFKLQLTKKRDVFTLERNLHVKGVDFQWADVDTEAYHIKLTQSTLTRPTVKLHVEDITGLREKHTYSEMTLVAEIARYLNLPPLEIETILAGSSPALEELLGYVNEFNELLHERIIPYLFNTLYTLNRYTNEEVEEIELIRRPEPPKTYYEMRGQEHLVALLNSAEYLASGTRSFHVDTYIFDSKPELALFGSLLGQDDVEKVFFTGMFTAGQSEFRFHYIDPDSHTVRCYYPDFLVIHKDGRIGVIEVKGERWLGDAVTKAKTHYASSAIAGQNAYYKLIAGKSVAGIVAGQA
nr:ATP-dependent DNA helicase PcrA [Tanacetum cinerariifolium]